MYNKVEKERELSEKYLRLKLDVEEFSRRNDHHGDFMVKMISLEIESLEKQLARLANIEPKMENNTPKVKTTTRGTTIHGGRYYEIWIDGELFLECTSCSADGPGNCGCWSC